MLECIDIKLHKDEKEVLPNDYDVEGDMLKEFEAGPTSSSKKLHVEFRRCYRLNVFNRVQNLIWKIVKKGEEKSVNKKYIFSQLDKEDLNPKKLEDSLYYHLHMKYRNITLTDTT